MKNILALLAVLLWAGLAQAIDWEDCTSGDAKASISIGKELCVDHVTNDIDSVILSVGKCPGVTIVYNPDDTGVATSMTVKVMTCVNPTADTDNCNAIDAVSLTGLTTFGEMYGAKAKWIYIKGSGDPGGTTPRTMVLCHW